MKFARTGSHVNGVAKGTAGYRERLTLAGETIGIYVSRDGERIPTSVVIVHYVKDGKVHFVPGRPPS